MEFHEIANILPLMEGSEFDALVMDIKEQGLLEPICLYEGNILDGRNRYKACEKAGVEPHFIKWAGGKPLEFIISKNLKRRHLNESQRAVVAARLADMRQGERTDLVEPSANLRKVISQPEAAVMLNISERMIQSVKSLEREAPELLPQIERGKISVHEAKMKVKTEKRQQEIWQQKEAIEAGAIELPKGKYEVIVIDPPWNYNSDYDPEGFRGAPDYPEMTNEELEQMAIPNADDCILFLWTTHKFIWEAKELLELWGFEYRNTLVWDKCKMGLGKLFRLQCEFCLVGIKGKPLLSNDNTHRDIIREDRREHSRKPEQFYEMVDTLCVGRKLDMFGRQKRPGWDIFGGVKWDSLKTI
ncbi:MAG: hypothetical protein DDT40_01569 [candidate division WS2 bacterium]|nr:hypothetical protein [Candidatus Psychracetigena formicireducens]